MTGHPAIDPTAPPSGTGCVECVATNGWWFHLRRCAACGHVGCCDSSPSQHATAHYRATGHPIVQSFEPGEDWFWDFATRTSWTSPRSSDRPPVTPQASRPQDPRVECRRTGCASSGADSAPLGTLNRARPHAAETGSCSGYGPGRAGTPAGWPVQPDQ